MECFQIPGERPERPFSPLSAYSWGVEAGGEERQLFLRRAATYPCQTFVDNTCEPIARRVEQARLARKRLATAGLVPVDR